MRRIFLAIVCMVVSLIVSAQALQQHTIAAGETLYGIARKYNVGFNDLLKANPQLGNGNLIKIGQKINIPAQKAEATTSTSTTTDPAKVAQTQNNATPAATTVLPALLVKSTTTVAATQQPQAVTTPGQQGDSWAGYLNSGCKEMYRVQKKDNLYRIALLYNLTIEELIEANSPMTIDSKLKKGTLLCIPYSKAEKAAQAQKVAAEQEAQRAAQQAQAERQAAKAKATSKSLIKMAVILPFKDGNDRASKMVEFYQGMLMAADSVKKQGINVEIHAIHSGSNEADIRFVLSRPELKNMDVIFGPLDAAQAGILGDFCRQNEIRLVMPFATTNTFGQNNPYVYQPSANSDDALRNATNIIINRFSNNTFTILRTETSDNRGMRFTTGLTEQLKAKGIVPNVVSITADDASLASAFNQFRGNVIVPDASSLTATTAVTQRLQVFQQEHPEFNIKLIGYPEYPTYTTTLAPAFHALDTYAYTTFYRDPLSQRSATFEEQFKHNFKREMLHTSPRYGMMGFDVAYYFLKGLSKFGDYFDENQEALHTVPFQNPIKFQQRNANCAYVNQHIQLVHYYGNQQIEVIK